MEETQPLVKRENVLENRDEPLKGHFLIFRTIEIVMEGSKSMAYGRNSPPRVNFCSDRDLVRKIKLVLTEIQELNYRDESAM